jgi:hypothetical protein
MTITGERMKAIQGNESGRSWMGVGGRIEKRSHKAHKDTKKKPQRKGF